MSGRYALVGFGIIVFTLSATQAQQVKETTKKTEQLKEAAKPPEQLPIPGQAAEVVNPPPDPVKEAERLLRDAKVAVDSPALIAFFKSRTLTDDDRARLIATIKKLGDDDFDVREAASEELAKSGHVALPILRAAAHDADVEIARRVENCLQVINQTQESAQIIAAATLLAHRKVSATVEVLLAYLPMAADDQSVLDGLREALVSYTRATDNIDPLIKKCLDDPDPERRALAVQVVGEALPGERKTVRKRLNDPSAKVRYLAASTLARAGDEGALPAILALLSDGPIEFAFQAEDMLCQLLDNEEKPPATLSSDETQRPKVAAAWSAWLEQKQKDKKLKLARLNEAEPLRGLTLIVEVDGGGVNGGRIWECGPDGKQRWELVNLGGPVDVQVLPGGRLLVPQYYSATCTERDRDGKVLWESPHLNSSTVGAQRLANGNTLIATMTYVVEFTRTNQKVAEFTNFGGTVYQAIRHRNGHTFVLAGNSITEFGMDHKQLRSINVGSLSGWGGFEILPNGNFLVAYYGVGNRYAELDQNGKTVWEHSTANAATRLDPTRVQRLRNGNTVVAGGNVMFVVEYDRDRKELWKVPTKGRPFSVRRY